MPTKEDLERVKQLDKYLGDIGARLSAMARGELPSFEKAIKEFIEARDKSKELQKQLEKMSKDQAKNVDKVDRAQNKLLKTEKEIEKRQLAKQKISKKLLDDLEDQKVALENEEEALSDLQGAMKSAGQQLGQLSIGAGGLAKVIGVGLLDAFVSLTVGMAKLGIDLIAKSFKLLEDGVQRVYELFERWTKAMGAFNMQLGAVSPNIQAATKEAKVWEGQIRGLTDQFGEGLQMYQEFVTGFKRLLPEEEAKGWGDLGIAMARGLGMGATAAGEFLGAAYQLDQTPKDVKESFGNIVAGATAAGVSVNKFSAELNESRDFMLGFGKQGQKMFIQAAAYAKKLGVSLKALQQFTKITDTFESATTMASRLNTVFGTTVNSLQLMLEQDPSKRLEMVRKELTSQGKTFDNLSRQEREFLGETMNLSQEELAGTLKAGQSLDKFREKQEKAHEIQMSEDALLRKSQLATAQTMFAFGAAFDDITKNLLPLLKPFTDLIGLTGAFDEQGNKVGKTFGEVMAGGLNEFKSFLKDIGDNKDFSTFMEEIATDAKDFIDEILKFVKSPLFKETFSEVIRFTKSVYDLIKSIVKGIWSVKDTLINTSMMMTNAYTKLFNFLNGGLGELAAMIVEKMEKIPGLIKDMVDTIVSWVKFLAGKVKEHFPNFTSLFDPAIAGAKSLMLFVDDMIKKFKIIDRIKSVFSKGGPAPEASQVQPEPSMQLKAMQAANHAVVGANRFGALAANRFGALAVPPSPAIVSPTSNANPTKMKLPESSSILKKKGSLPTAAQTTTKKIPGKAGDVLASAEIKIVAGDVYLDGALVGRHIARLAADPGGSA